MKIWIGFYTVCTRTYLLFCVLSSVAIIYQQLANGNSCLNITSGGIQKVIMQFKAVPSGLLYPRGIGETFPERSTYANVVYDECTRCISLKANLNLDESRSRYRI